jgi:hypothetical protein
VEEHETVIISLAKIELKTEDRPTKYRFIVSINGHKMHEGVHVEEHKCFGKGVGKV